MTHQKAGGRRQAAATPSIVDHRRLCVFCRLPFAACRLAFAAWRLPPLAWRY